MMMMVAERPICLSAPLVTEDEEREMKGNARHLLARGDACNHTYTRQCLDAGILTNALCQCDARCVSMRKPYA